MAEEKKPTGRMKKQLTVGDLIATHELYERNVGEWTFLTAVYEGIREIIRHGLIERHEREPILAYQRRIKELFGFGYSKSVVEIFHFFLFKKEPTHKLGKLLEDKRWKLFQEDSNLYGMDYNATIMEIALWAAVQGHMGILVDKANATFQTVEQQVNAKVYPYLAKYHPKAILDWQWDRDEYNRPYLSYLKLEDDDGQYRIWEPDRWEIWELPDDKDGNPDKSNEGADAVFVDAGTNPIGVIPFIWFYNQRSKKMNIGNSDIHEVTRIDLSVIRNMSQIEETIYFAAFPMMRKPMRDAKPTEVNAPQQDDEVGVQTVLEFDPEHPESKPDWLDSAVAEPVQATLNTVDKKIEEIYRAANIGGMAATEPSRYQQSGVAKRIDFQLLNSKMVSKAINLEDAENKILEFWCRWENLWEQYKDDSKMGRAKTFDIEELATTLDDALTAKTVVISNRFNELLQKQVARQVLPTATEQQMADIDKEIEANVKRETPPGDNTPDIDNPDLEGGDRDIINRGTSPEATPPVSNQTGQTQQGGGEE